MATDLNRFSDQVQSTPIHILSRSKKDGLLELSNWLSVCGLGTIEIANNFNQQWVDSLGGTYETQPCALSQKIRS
jgi:hypothetical protein